MNDFISDVQCGLIREAFLDTESLENFLKHTGIARENEFVRKVEFEKDYGMTIYLQEKN